MSIASGRERWIVGAFVAGTFVMGCAEVVVIGALDLIAADLEVTTSQAGQLVTANALGVAFGGPVLAFLTSRLNRRAVLLGALLSFAAFNLPPMLSMGLPVLVPARVAAGAAQGLFIAAAITTVTIALPKEHVGRAMAVVISGFAVSGIVGIPVGTWMGNAFGWSSPFAVVVVATAALFAIAVAVAPSIHPERMTGPVPLLKHALSPRVLAVLLTGTLVFAAMQAGLTYIVPFMANGPGIAGHQVGFHLLLFGLAAALGSLLGGKVADTRSPLALVIGAGGVGVALLSMYAFAAVLPIVVIALLLLGFCAQGITVPLQFRVDVLAGPGAVLAASLPASAANLGDALGAFSGGLVIESRGVDSVMAIGFGIALVALTSAIVNQGLRPHPTHELQPSR